MEKQRYKTHNSYGNVAYAPNHHAPQRPVRQTQTAVPRPVPQRRPAPRPLTRKRVQVREADVISFDSIIGYVATLLLAGLLIACYAQLATQSDEVVKLRGQLSQLQSQEKILSAQYERHFDIGRIEETLGDQLVRPSSDQVVYIDLSQPDAVNQYDTTGKSLNFFQALFSVFQ